jgi:ribosomal protein L25 (general stress protein Ctc)
MNGSVPVLAICEKLSHFAPGREGHTPGFVYTAQTEPIIPLALGVKQTVEMLLNKEEHPV